LIGVLVDSKTGLVVDDDKGGRLMGFPGLGCGTKRKTKSNAILSVSFREPRRFDSPKTPPSLGIARRLSSRNRGAGRAKVTLAKKRIRRDERKVVQIILTMVVAEVCG